MGSPRQRDQRSVRVVGVKAAAGRDGDQAAKFAHPYFQFWVGGRDIVKIRL